MIQFVLEADRELFEDAFRFAQQQVRKLIETHPDFYPMYTTNGRWDLVAEIRADTLQSFDQVLGRIRRVEGISGTETSLLLSTHKL